MLRTKQNVISVLKSSAGVGAGAGGIYGLFAGGWSDVFAAERAGGSSLETFVLGCCGGIATGAIAGAVVGAIMGAGIYELLKHE